MRHRSFINSARETSLKERGKYIAIVRARLHQYIIFCHQRRIGAYWYERTMAHEQADPRVNRKSSDSCDGTALHGRSLCDPEPVDAVRFILKSHA